ncbi:Protein of unknown function [Gryllus bimaculatus]|nr:Protein of unknown function [Gryllus bimaculatus]
MGCLATFHRNRRNERQRIKDKAARAQRLECVCPEVIRCVPPEQPWRPPKSRRRKKGKDEKKKKDQKKKKKKGGDGEEGKGPRRRRAAKEGQAREQRPRRKEAKKARREEKKKKRQKERKAKEEIERTPPLGDQTPTHWLPHQRAYSKRVQHLRGHQTLDVMQNLGGYQTPERAPSRREVASSRRERELRAAQGDVVRLKEQLLCVHARCAPSPAARPPTRALPQDDRIKPHESHALPPFLSLPEDRQDSRQADRQTGRQRQTDRQTDRH